jgi:hypothetical protein
MERFEHLNSKMNEHLILLKNFEEMEKTRNDIFIIPKCIEEKFEELIQ